MKKLLALVFGFLLFLSAGYPCYAAVPDAPQEQVTYFDDGSYFITAISDVDAPVISRATSSVTKSKTSTYYNANNEALWYVKVTGTFTYGDGSAKCTSSSVSAGSYHSSWKVSDTSASKSGASATAKATGKHYQKGVVTNTVHKTVTLTCDSKGNFS